MSGGLAVMHAWRARVLAGRHSVSVAVRQSSLRVAGMALFASATAAGIYLVFRAAFRFVGELDVIGPILLVRLLSLFFFALFVMLVMSNVLVAFQTLFRSRELEFWAVQPLRPETIHDIRSLEIGLISSWAFLFLGIPLLLAHGSAISAPWRYYAIVPVVLLLFAAVAHEAGLLAIIVLVRLFPGIDIKRLAVLAVAALVPLVVVVARAFRVQEIGPEDDVSELLVHALEGLGRTQFPMLPGYWASETLRAVAAGESGRAAFFGWALLCTAGFLGLLAREASRLWLVPAQQILRGRGLARPAFRRSFAHAGGPAAGPLRALEAKDWTLLRREPAQWSQALLVAVLATVYVLNLRSLPDLAPLQAWGRLAAALNTGVVLLLMSTLTTRFAFPLVSLEGRRAWIVFCAPIRRGSVVRQKMLVSLALTAPFGLGLAAFSTGVLGVERADRVVTLAAAAAGSVALSGLAVGLGALFPNLKEESPARIVSGFGGTTSFLAGLAYVVAMTVLTGAPSFLHALGRIDSAAAGAATAACLSGALLLSLLTAGMPIILGIRRLESMEL